MPSIRIPALREDVSIQNFARGILGISDLAAQIAVFHAALKNKNSDAILTWCVRQMSVSLRSILLEKRGGLLVGMLNDGCFPQWPKLQEGLLAKIEVQASPEMEVEYEIETGESRRLRTPEYTHAFKINCLHGIAKCKDGRFALRETDGIWTRSECETLQDWVRQELFEVDGLKYDLANIVKTVADKEGAHIDRIVHTDGIYTGNQERTESKTTNDEAYVRSRLIKFGPFSYPHLVCIAVSRYLVITVRKSIIKNEEQIKSIGKQFTITQETIRAIQERIAIIMGCPNIGRIDGLPLRVVPERAVMRPGIPMGMANFEEERRIAKSLPQYGESYIGVPRPRKPDQE